MDYDFPKIDTTGKAVVRYYSMINPWLDFVVIVDVDNMERAFHIVNEAMDEFWDSNDFCYGDLVNEGMANAGIEFEFIVHDPYVGCDYFCPEYEDAWEKYIDTLYEHASETKSIW